MKEFIAVVILETKNLSTGVKYVEETFIQVVGKNEEDVREKSARYGKSYENLYKNLNGEELQIKFIKIDDINPILRDEFENDIRELYVRSSENFIEK